MCILCHAGDSSLLALKTTGYWPQLSVMGKLEIHLNIDKDVSTIFVKPVRTFWVPKPFGLITPVRRIQTIVRKVISGIDSSHSRLSIRDL